VGGRGSRLQPALLLVLIAAEALFLGLRFDGEMLAASGSSAVRALARLLGGASAFLVTLVAASLLLGSKRWSEELALLREAGRPRAFPLRLAAQLASFASLYGASTQLFDAVRVGSWEIVAWWIALLATFGFWLSLWGRWY
jgi:hypothetical protein